MSHFDHHHCGTCGCCGGRIPCGVHYEREWTSSGECPGHITNEGLCGALVSVTERDEEGGPGSCSV